jgi:hypothetical protein
VLDFARLRAISNGEKGAIGCTYVGAGHETEGVVELSVGASDHVVAATMTHDPPHFESFRMQICACDLRASARAPTFKFMAAAYDICPYLLCSSHFYRLKEHPRCTRSFLLLIDCLLMHHSSTIFRSAHRLDPQITLPALPSYLRHIQEDSNSSQEGSARPSVSLRYTYFHKTPDYRNTQTNLMAEDRVTPVDDIADDDSKLEEKASKLVREL